MLFIFVVSSSSSTALARAKPRVAVLKFSGRKAKSARKAFLKAIKKRSRLISTKKYSRMAKRLGVEPQSEEGIAAICAKLRCKAVVIGALKRLRRKRHQLVIRIHSGSGEKIQTIGVKKTKRIKAAAKALGKASLKLFAKGNVPPRSGDADSGDDAPPVVIYTPDEDKSTDKAGATDTTDTTDSTDATDSSDTADGAEDPLLSGVTPIQKKRRAAPAKKTASPKDGAQSQRFSVSVSMGMAMRSFELKGANPAQDTRYDGGIYSEFTVAAEVYPIAFFSQGFAKNIGIRLAYNRHMAISTTLPDNNFNLETTSQELLADLRLNWPIFSKATSPIIQAWFGGGFREFFLSEKACPQGSEQSDPSCVVNPVLTAFNHGFLSIGVGAVVPIFTPLFAIEASFDARPLLSVGDAAIQSYGERAGGFGFGVRGGFRGQHRLGFLYFLSVEYLSFSMSFQGLDQNDPNQRVRTGYPDRAEPTKGTDSYLRFWLGLGYAM
jgi:hypothetical protein